MFRTLPSITAETVYSQMVEKRESMISRNYFLFQSFSTFWDFGVNLNKYFWTFINTFKVTPYSFNASTHYKTSSKRAVLLLYNLRQNTAGHNKNIFMLRFSFECLRSTLSGILREKSPKIGNNLCDLPGKLVVYLG